SRHRWTDDRKIQELIQLWISGQLISSASIQSGLALGKTERLTIDEIKLSPNPIGSSSKATLNVEGSGIASVKLEIFNLAGAKVFEQEAFGNTLEFHAIDDRGQPLANGVYLCIIVVRGFNNEIIKSQIKKIVVLR
ncbi:MAG: hypothetical protein QXQ40_02535, partial [Candidatus Aenigmatarchaeota archaeon]